MEIIQKQNYQKQIVSTEELLVYARKVVTCYVVKKIIPLKEEEDVQMAIVEKFLLKQDKIFNAFSGGSKISTYCIAVLNRMCCEIIRKELKHWKNKADDEIGEETMVESNAMEQLAIKYEIDYLQKIIQLFDAESAKIVLFLAYYFRLKINSEDILNYGTKNKLNILTNLFDTNVHQSKGDLFKNLSEAVKIAEDKDAKPDAVRMWLNKTVDKIIIRLNGPFGRANYNKENFQILFEFFYMKKSS